MNKKAISCAIGVVILVSACSSNGGGLDPEGDAASTSETPAAETNEPESDPELVETSDVEEEETEEVEPEQSEPATSVRGNLVKEIGEEGGVTDAAGDLLIAFTVSEVETDFDCTADFAEKPENDKFVGLKFEVTTDASLAQETESSFWLSSVDFSAWDEDGKRVNDPVGSSYACVSESEMLPSPMGPGEVAEGWIVLDVPENATAAGFGIQTAEGLSGWEWDITH